MTNQLHKTLVVCSTIIGLGACASVDERPRVKAWGTPVLIEDNDDGEASYPDVAVDARGNAMAVWHQREELLILIWAGRYAIGSGWNRPQIIDTYSSGMAMFAQIATNANGNAVAVWSLQGSARSGIWSNNYTNEKGWGTAALASIPDALRVSSPRVAMDANGNAIAVWNQSDGTRDNVWASRFTPGTGWGQATLIETDNVGSARSPHVAMDNRGNAVAVWYQSDGTRENIWANRYIVGSGWRKAELIETDNAGNALAPQIAMDALGNSMVVWYQSDSTRDNIWANRYIAGSGWGKAELIETDNAGNASSPHVAVDLVGNAVAVWYQSDGKRENIIANRYTVGKGWGTAVPIETDNGDAYFPRVAVDNHGNAMAVWEQWDGARTNIWANRYTAADWGQAVLVESDNAGTARMPRIVLDRSGNATAVWYQSDGKRNNIWTNRFE